ncbi:homocitrate synthase/isopropylmalate synthase family protein [Clostridium estertheticum]|uniref:homocitrate synthase/isopropylmalate synthase family protein n=1 Tax=Clostridium estertheticum TaxID=238834 RepID=UPI001C7E041A|nr:hypothetical protein [Clostridium estertheticum]MBX4267730.1 hypothetical protein [Clostridium estertheticum]WLC77977.1 hypothetical protein KTC98_12010 [Clostridium estertheticum]
MSIIINGKETYIIDRTLMNITKKRFNENEVHEFTMNLRRIGVDFFEVDERTFNIVRPLITSEVFIFRIDKISQLEICKRNGIEYILVKEEDLEFFNIKCIEENYNFKIILEIDINSYKSNFMNKINKNIDKFFCLRFKGESNWLTYDYIQGNYNVKTNIYASDKFAMATASCFQAIIKGIDYITTAFCGRDGTYGTTPLEEILVSTKVILGEEVNEDISVLSVMRLQYEKITYSKVPNNKPIIGKDIFKYESGVHVAGIEKNPITYEPFKPEIVGMKRKLALGKHSGKNSIHAKLKELNIENKFIETEILDILESIKCKSIKNKMELSDEDFIEICKGIKRLRYV